MNYKSRAIPVQATQFCRDGDHPSVERISNAGQGGYALTSDLGDTTVSFGDWIVEFPNGEVHVVRDVHFKQRFEHVKEYTKSELSYASRLAASGDCV